MCWPGPTRRESERTRASMRWPGQGASGHKNVQHHAADPYAVVNLRGSLVDIARQSLRIAGRRRRRPRAPGHRAGHGLTGPTTPENDRGRVVLSVEGSSLFEIQRSKQLSEACPVPSRIAAACSFVKLRPAPRGNGRALAANTMDLAACSGRRRFRR